MGQLYGLAPGQASPNTVRRGKSPITGLAIPRAAAQVGAMFTIEHEFDATVITLVDEGAAPLIEDVAIHAFEDCITVEQLDPRTDRVMRVTLSLAQARDLAAALNLPEGIYRRAELGKARP